MSFLYGNLTTLKDAEEAEALRLNSFNLAVSWELGNFARNWARKEYPQRAVVIDISSTNGQVLFRTTTKSGTSLNNDNWIQKKKNTVQGCGSSSFYDFRLKEGSEPGLSMADIQKFSAVQYAGRGGSVPIKVKGVDYLVGMLTISGTEHEEDHLLALEILEKFPK